MEVANGYTEQGDPEVQSKMFADQTKLKDSGDEELMAADENYIEALNHGLPPAGGCGIGVD